MTFLELCKRVHLLGRFGEDKPGTAPSTVTAQTGVLAEIVSWVQMAYLDIQRQRSRWLFLNKLGTLVMTIGQSGYTPASSGITDFRELIGSSAESTWPFVGVYKTTTADETQCHYIPYEQWILGIYDRGLASAGNGRPSYFTVKPDNTLAFYPKPDFAYSVRIPYKRTLHELVADTDLPIIPADYHMLIVWRVISDYYCTTREAQLLDKKAKEQIRPLWIALCRDQLPEFTTAS